MRCSGPGPPYCTALPIMQVSPPQPQQRPSPRQCPPRRPNPRTDRPRKNRHRKPAPPLMAENPDTEPCLRTTAPTRMPRRHLIPGPCAYPSRSSCAPHPRPNGQHTIRFPLTLRPARSACHIARWVWNWGWRERCLRLGKCSWAGR